MADNDDLVGVAGPRDLGQILRETVDALVPFGSLAVRELPGPDRIAEQIEHVGLVLEIAQRAPHEGEEDRRSRKPAQRLRRAERIEPLAEHEARPAATSASNSRMMCGQVMKVANRQLALQNRPMVPRKISRQ
jgi:hypothetical protein